MQRWKTTKGQRRGGGGGCITLESSSGSRDPCSSQRRRCWALRWAQRSRHQRGMQTRQSSPAVSLWGLQAPVCWLHFTCRLRVAQPRLLLGRKATSPRLTSPGHVCWLPKGWQGGPCPGKLAKFAYGAGKPPAELEHGGATTPSRWAGMQGGGTWGPPPPQGAKSTGQLSPPALLNCCSQQLKQTHLGFYPHPNSPESQVSCRLLLL